MSKACYDWIKDTIADKGIRMDGAYVLCDYGYKEIVRREWNHALITQVAFPALDVRSQGPATLTVKFRPEAVGSRKGSGLEAPYGALKPLQPPTRKQWLVRDFVLQIDGLEEACRHVTRIEALYYPGCGLEITLPLAWADPFFAWHERFVLRGERTERQGSLSYLTPAKDELFWLDSPRPRSECPSRRWPSATSPRPLEGRLRRHAEALAAATPKGGGA
jgi:hypothetical protein